ncbi:prohibitin family protein [Glutamicibacter halophytocola]|uniref:prohibitin family protein n=1 Tax=Glutamicibacter halophytocola TaxID=1933880 RepID=UPI0015C54AEF|nr:prohibitin family protein [Glutamicibacter halophytocola]NQD41436.1 prohibitin family protein [Glutamicibacter halophytocola]
MQNDEHQNKRVQRLSLGIATGLLALAGLITLFSSMRTVDTGKIGVVTRFGKTTGRELSEGLAWVMPWGVDRVSIYDVKIQKEEVPSTAATKDLQDVNGTVVVNYEVKRGEVSTIHKTIGVEFKDKLVTPAIHEVFKSAAAKFNAGELVTNRAALKADVTHQLATRLEKYGITVRDVSITNFQFSEAFTQAIEQKQVAEQEAQRAQFNLERANTDALAQKAQSETLSAEYLQKLAIDKWDGRLPSYLGGGTVFNIPLK